MLTFPVVPTGAPQNLTIINSTSTSVTISWDSVECIHRNGLITHYQLVYEPVDIFGNNPSTMISSGEPDDGGSYTATRLDPSSSHLFKVAAVNKLGFGPFATVTVPIKESTSLCRVDMFICLLHTSMYNDCRSIYTIFDCLDRKRYSSNKNQNT